jgi:diguanylate cyclase (GGDEF)-like protein
MPDRTASSGSRSAGGAFWPLLRRIVVLAACVDIGFFLLFWAIGSPWLQWMNVGSVALYGAAYWLIGQRRGTVAIALIWLEVLVHATVGTLLIGWSSGFSYFLMIMIPAIGVGTRRVRATLMMVALLAFYLALDRYAALVGPVAPISEGALAVVRAANVVIVFAMFASLTFFYVGTVRRAERELALQATRDPLTRLSNRRHFWSLAESSLDRRDGVGQDALLLVDIDLFKRVNDEYGHAAGDRVLTAVAERLRDAAREHDIVARWGGEEFLVLLPGTDIAGAKLAAERLRTKISETPIDTGTASLAVTVSIGATLVGDWPSLDEAIARADRALYRSKAEGRDRTSMELATAA